MTTENILPPPPPDGSTRFHMIAIPHERLMVIANCVHYRLNDLAVTLKRQENQGMDSNYHISEWFAELHAEIYIDLKEELERYPGV